MSFVVKNTTKWSFLDLICPHACRGCGRVGAILCERCKKYINVGQLQVKPEYAMEFDNLFICGRRGEILGCLVKEYKYHSVRAIGAVLAEMMAKTIFPDFGQNTKVILVPLPTITKHVKRRGLDHTLVMAKKLGELRGWKVETVLKRMNNTVQVGMKAEKRQEQAKTAYGIKKKLSPEPHYLLVDDVCTTGASLLAAKAELKKGGAKKVSAVVVAWSE